MGNNNSKKRVYFLGAGASKASEFMLPTMNEFFKEEDFTRKEYHNLRDFIGRYFPEQNISGLNLEDVITRLELSMDKFGSFGEHPEPYLDDARREFSRYVHKRLTYQPIVENGQERYWCEDHKKLFEQLTDQDSIITLNYDLIVDHTLSKFPKKIRYGSAGGDLLVKTYGLLDGIPTFGLSVPKSYMDSGFYLKLHGSIDWFYCANRTCRKHQLFSPNRIGDEKELISPGDLCILCGAPLVSVIIPPTMNKTFDEYPKLGLLWSLAFRKIRAADELVLIGMSLPDSDYYLKWLINSAIRSRKKDEPLKVVVVNKIDDKEEEIRYMDKIKKLTGVSPEYWNGFREYVKNIKKA